MQEGPFVACMLYVRIGECTGETENKLCITIHMREREREISLIYRHDIMRHGFSLF